MTMAENVNTLLNFDQPFVRFAQRNMPGNEKTRKRLNVPARKEPAWPKTHQAKRLAQNNFFHS